jgi:anti-sigma B factor antagonist
MTHPSARPAPPRPDAEPSGFDVTVESLSQVTLIRVQGEVDMLTRCRLAAAVGDGHACPGELVVDLSAVTFIDVGGCRVLADAEEQARVRGTTLRVVAGPAVERVRALLLHPSGSADAAPEVL